MEHDPVQRASHAEAAAPHDDTAARRSLLTATPNPEGRLDYLVSLSGRLSADQGSPITLTIRYVPDRLIVSSAAWMAYTARLSDHETGTLESLASVILSDFANELVPRWLEVRLRHALPDGGVQAVGMQERQPQWSDAGLAALLRGE